MTSTRPLGGLNCRTGRRAAELFEIRTSIFDHGPYTSHQLRHSRLTHAAENGASTPVLLMELSDHVGAEPGQVRPGIRRPYVLGAAWVADPRTGMWSIAMGRWERAA